MLALYNFHIFSGTLFRGSRGKRLVQFLYNDLSGTSATSIAIIPDMSDTDVATLVNKPHDYPHMAAVSAVLNMLLSKMSVNWCRPYLNATLQHCLRDPMRNGEASLV
jgi:hypothetical protein